MSSEDTLGVAEELLRTARDQAGYRAAASRAYMAAFQHVRDHPRAGFTAGKTAEDHRDLIEHLKRSSDPQVRRLGYDHLPRLRSLRNQADYDMANEFTRGQAEEAMERATEIIFDYLPK